MATLSVGYVNVFVGDFDRALDFYTNKLQLSINQSDSEFGYASFQAGPISFAIAQTDDVQLVGRHTGVGFMARDINVEYERLISAGVEFDMPPTEQPWGGVLALFKDPDGNIFYLDPGHG